MKIASAEFVDFRTIRAGGYRGCRGAWEELLDERQAEEKALEAVKARIADAQKRRAMEEEDAHKMNNQAALMLKLREQVPLT